MNRGKHALVVGGGPAGLMAAEEMARAGLAVTLCEAMPSLGRKLLMAGKSGLNLTRRQENSAFLAAYEEAADWLAPCLAAFGPAEVETWVRGLGQPVFAGSTGRVFPEVMKASPLLRAWLARLGALGVEARTRWRWTGWDGRGLRFDTPGGPRTVTADATVLALGGASWARLGSDGAWTGLLAEKAVELAPFAPANVAVSVTWSAHMAPVFGSPLKNVAFLAGGRRSRGEAVITRRGLEGGGIYSICRGLREGAALEVDLLPDLTQDDIRLRLEAPRGKASLSNHLRKRLRLDRARLALLMELGRPVPGDPAALAALLKRIPVPGARPGPLDQAISVAGGVARSALDNDLMLRAVPGVHCAGEMLDWEAPTGGYLLTACLATGRWAGRAVAGKIL